MRCLSLVAALWALCGVLVGQQNVQRDSSAVSAVQNAVAALGGSAMIGQISDSTTQGTFPGNNGSTTFTWQTEAWEFNYSSQSGSANRTLVSGHGVPADVTNGNVLPIGAHVLRSTLPYHLPGLVLLNELNNQSYSLIYIGREKNNGIQVIHVLTVDNTDLIGSTVTPQDWYLDTGTYLPVSVSFNIPDELNSSSYTPASLVFGSYTQVSNILVPSTFVETILSNNTNFTVQSVTFNTGIPPSAFDVP
jgi:hypothetical protein